MKYSTNCALKALLELNFARSDQKKTKIYILQ